MKFKDLLAEQLNKKELVLYLPASYQKIGDICLIKLNKSAEKYKSIIGNAILKLFPYFSTVCLQKEITGELREPNVKVIAGNTNTKTTHTEFGYKFNIDVSKTMWSKGNHCERKRLIKEMQELPNASSAVVIDMFAGIGYWSIPIAKFVKQVFAIDKNKISYEYLCENIRLNRLTNIIPILTDCRKAKITEKADVIIMGYFPNTAKFLPKAYEFAKQNAIIYYHDLASSEQVLFKKLNKYQVLEIRKVKQYTPHINHYVAKLIK